MINLIGISGKMGNGKDTVANIIQYLVATESTRKNLDIPKEKFRAMEFNGLTPENWESIRVICRWEIKSFAAKLKEISSMLTGLPLETFKTQEGKLKELDSMWDYYTLKFLDADYGIEVIEKRNTKEELLEFIRFMVDEDYDNFDGDYDKLASENVDFKNLSDKIVHHKMTVREVLQLVGTDCMRDNLHQNVWVNSLFADYKLSELNTSAARFPEDIEIGEKVIPKYPKWLIPDTRFLNEAKAIKDRGGIVLRVNRDIASNTNTHPSETALDNYQFDYIINNNGTFEDLIEETYKFLKHYEIV